VSQQFIRRIDAAPGEAVTLTASTITYDAATGYTERPIAPGDFTPYPSAITWERPA